MEINDDAMMSAKLYFLSIFLIGIAGKYWSHYCKNKDNDVCKMNIVTRHVFEVYDQVGHKSRGLSET